MKLLRITLHAFGPYDIPRLRGNLVEGYRHSKIAGIAERFWIDNDYRSPNERVFDLLLREL